jgi:hypothetical protein
MENFTREDRGIFQGIKVPFCLNGIILAFMAYVIFVAGGQVLGWVMLDNAAYDKVVFHSTAKVASHVPVLTRPLNIIKKYSFAEQKRLKDAYDKYLHENAEYNRKVDEKYRVEPVGPEEFKIPQWWQLLIFAVWFLFIWSFFAGAINRTAAYRIARDESITLKEGLNFGAQTWLNHFLAILFVAIFIAAAFYMCALGGLLCRIPFVGELVLIVGFLFILVAAFLITLLLAGLLFGFNMISSAIGVDKVDSFDAISRAYSYILGRPWQTLLYALLPFLFVIFFLYFGIIFREVAVSAVAAGMGDKFDPIYKFAVNGEPWKQAIRGLEATPPWTLYVSALVIRIFLWLAQLFIIATAVAYWLSSQTKAYFLLRKEVDGDEVEEMYLDEEEEAFDAPMPAPLAEATVEKKEEEKAGPEKEEGKKHTEEELTDLPMDDLRAIGEKFGLTGRSKKKIIERILKAQEE